MSFDTRNNSALSKRAEQLRRWEESETNRQPVIPKLTHLRKIQFSSGCVFLASCMSGDKDEVVRLIETGADIDTANVDGLTALHQACIDDNLEMVEFLVQNGADVNRQDNEGWTPLHATSSCGFVSIAGYLIENGADLAAVNSDGDLAIDLVQTASMEDLLHKHIEAQAIDCEDARGSEERLMLSDAKKWLRSDASEADRPHPRTGATALHVAAAKGYTKVLSLLLAGRADVDKQDNDGWTPLHAAAHWGQKEAAKMMVAAMADMDIKNYAGQTAIDVADTNMIRYLEELKKNNKRTKRRPASQIRISDNIENHIDVPSKVIRVDVKADGKEDDDKPKPPNEPAAPPPAENNTAEDDMPWRRTTGSALRSRTQYDSPPKTQVPEKDAQPSETEVILRRTQSFENDEKFYQKYNELRARIKANSCPTLPATPTTGVIGSNINTTNTYSVQRSASLKDHRQLRKPATVSPQTNPSTPATTPTSGQMRRSFVPPARDEESETQRKAHAKRVRETRRSTQGVTLDEIKSAEELVKKKNNMNNNNNSEVPGTINDRVPTMDGDSSVKLVTTTEPSTSSTLVEDQITATYTITAPNSNNKKTSSPTASTPPSSADTTKEQCPNDDDDKVIASYTIPPPKSSHSSTTTATSKLGATDSERELHKDTSPTGKSTTESISATINVPTATATVIETKKTELSDEPTTKLSASATTRLKTTTSDNVEKSLTNTTKAATATTAAYEKPLKSDADLLKNEFIFTRNSRDKRSLFDIDNASSLSLAEKLRNEANKYIEDSNVEPIVVTATLARNESIDSDSSSVNRSKDSTPSSPQHLTPERRPSWRLKIDTGSKFKLEDAATSAAPASNSGSTVTNATGNTSSSSISQRRNSSNTSTTNSTPRPVSAPIITETGKDNAAEVTLSLRRPKSVEDKENDKENDSRSAQANQTAIQRRRRPKRRSTGVVHVDMDDLDPDRQESFDGDDKESGSERTSRSRLGSTSSAAENVDLLKEGADSAENGELIDYKALYEAAKADNDKLKIELKKKDEDLLNAKATVDRFANATTKNTLSELEKRERRAMERKLSEMEEELKQLDALRTENQRLKDENGALIRVISKLSK